MSKDDGESNKSDEEWETDEEILVQAELTGIIQANPLTDEKVKVKFIGLETENPIAQFGNQVFSGKYEDTIGTSVFFKVKKDFETLGESDATQPNDGIDYFCKTDKRLVFQRVFLNEKVRREEEENCPDETTKEG